MPPTNLVLTNIIASESSQILMSSICRAYASLNSKEHAEGTPKINTRGSNKKSGTQPEEPKVGTTVYSCIHG
jgi:hypothetical protein